MSVIYQNSRKIHTSLRCWIVAFSILGSVQLHAQNLISNPSFEVTNDVTEWYLDSSQTIFPGTRDWFSATYRNTGGIHSDTAHVLRAYLNLYKPYKTPTYALLVCGGSYYTPAGTGKGFIQSHLKDTLDARCYYKFSFHGLPVATDFFGDSLITASWCSANRLGAYFSKNRIFYWDTVYHKPASPFAFVNQNITPQVAIPTDSFIMDTTSYTYIEQVFKANGGERYITMGNFYSMADTECKNFRTGQVYSDTSSLLSEMWHSLWNIDDLELIKVPPPDSLLTSGNDTVICPGDTLWLEAYSNDSTSGIKWDNGSTDSLRAVTAPGTYWVELDCGCDLTLVDTIVVSPYESLPALTIDDTVVCSGETVAYNFPADLSYTLNGTPVSQSFAVKDTGNYTLEVSNVCYTDTYNFTFNYKPVDDLPHLNIPDTALCEGEEAKYNLPAGFDYNLNGTPVSGVLQIEEQGAYELTVSNSCDSSTYKFEVNDEGCETLLFIPNAFTPDGDGLNDCFKVSVVQEVGYQISIFNRWGQLVYKSTNPDECWNGRFNGTLTFGVFTYKITVDTGFKKIVEYGQVTVLR